ncbi:uncharacterized protein LY79DRAFT_416094 [Colletotrichum navitas]|uniref:Secreted protein n=1 Tax=Colletotrichum navitas TaxID=681940 RepID=A0AAD8PN02_9PEZI|nr:uncharacterized protein LY79DRAFT_416094 [Colletotrichum navitas]KAK1573160.1 hypothetical protein LY79DRAFT_416094 [Colletotrichum navitas]
MTAILFSMLALHAIFVSYHSHRGLVSNHEQDELASFVTWGLQIVNTTTIRRRGLPTTILFTTPSLSRSELQRRDSECAMPNFNTKSSILRKRPLSFLSWSKTTILIRQMQSFP